MCIGRIVIRAVVLVATVLTTIQAALAGGGCCFNKYEDGVCSSMLLYQQYLSIVWTVCHTGYIVQSPTP